MAKTPVSEQVQVNFRMPVDLRDRIKSVAEENNRSMNAEIVATLEEAYPAKLSLLDQATLEWLAENIPEKKLDQVLQELIEWRQQDEVQALIDAGLVRDLTNDPDSQ